jgi:hypothetical protein
VAVAATLSGVVLTLFANALLERRRAREAQRLESLRLAAEQRKWLRDERTTAYASFSLAGEEVLQFLRADVPALLSESGAHATAATQTRWGNLRTEFRKAYNRVQLLGAEQPRAAAMEFWRIGRDSGNDMLRDIMSAPDVATVRAELTQRLEGARNRLGALGNRFLDACREDLQGQ